MAPFRIEMSRYDLAECAGICLYYVPPSKRDWKAVKARVDAKLQQIGLRLTNRPHWIKEWQVEAVDGWKHPAEMLFNSHWHFTCDNERRDYERMPSHIFVDNYLGYLHYIEG